jgi:hypothetical protein
MKEQKSQKKVKAHVSIERPWKREEGKEQGRRVEHTGLEVAEKWRAAEIIWAPVGNESVLQGLREEMLCRIEPPMNVPKEEGVVGEKNRVKKEEHEEGGYREGGMFCQRAQSHRSSVERPAGDLGVCRQDGFFNRRVSSTLSMPSSHGRG